MGVEILRILYQFLSEKKFELTRIMINLLLPQNSLLLSYTGWLSRFSTRKANICIHVKLEIYRHIWYRLCLKNAFTLLGITQMGKKYSWTASSLHDLSLIYWQRNFYILPKMQLYGFHIKFMIMKLKRDTIWSISIQKVAILEHCIELWQLRFHHSVI